MLLRFVSMAALSAAVAAPAAAETVVIGKPDWPSAATTAHILADVIEDRFGHDVRIRDIGTKELLGAIDRGEADIHPEIWLPSNDALVAEFAEERGTLTLSDVTGSASQHMCTTRHTHETTGLTRLADLTDPEIAAHFDTDQDGRGELWIGAFDWSTTPVERVRARTVGYDETMLLLTMPEDQAMASVDAAVAFGSPIVFYCYAPHYLFALHDLVKLDEPEHDPDTWQVLTSEQDVAWLAKSKAATAWEPSTYRVGFASSLAEDAPDLVAFLQNVKISPEDAEAMSYAHHVEGLAPEEIAKNFVADNKDRIEGWLK